MVTERRIPLVKWSLNACLVALGVTFALKAADAIRYAGADVNDDFVYSTPLIGRETRLTAAFLAEAGIPSLERGALLLVVSPTCPGCNRTASELGRLLSAARQSREVVVLGREPASELDAWLQGRDIPRSSVRQLAAPDRLGLLVTPTLLLVDAGKSVTDIWLGVVTPDAERHIMRRLAENAEGPPFDNAAFADEIGAAEVEVRLQSGSVMGVDIRRRNDPSRSTRANVLNIPYDELMTRAPVELPTGMPIAVFCPSGQYMRCRAAGALLRGAGFADVSIVKTAGR